MTPSQEPPAAAPEPAVARVEIDHTRPTTVIFGCGYVGTRLARALLADGAPVRACARHLDRLQPLAELGAELFYIDASKPKQFGPALRGAVGARVVYSIPPPPGLPSGEAVRRATQAALGAGAYSFVYLGTSGLYGKTPDPDWVDEESTVDLQDADMAPRHQDESAVEGASMAGLRTVILRLAAIYGPGKGVRARLRKGDYKLIDGGQHWISRIHIDDLVAIIRAASERAPQGSLYLVGDDRPTTQREYAEWLCSRLGLPLPASIASLAPGAPRTFLRGRRLRNEKVKRELGLTLRYPSFVEGEQQIEAEENGGAVAAPPAARAEPAAPSAVADGGASGAIEASPVAVGAPPATAAPHAAMQRDRPAPPRPLSIRHHTELSSDGGWSYPGAAEVHGVTTQLARPLGMHRIAVNHVVLAPGRRSGLPHAHSEEEELVYVLEGEPEVWLDGVVHKLVTGDVVAFAPGTGVAHVLLNNTDRPVRLLVVGEQRRAGDRVTYPLHHAREVSLPNEHRWADAPRHSLGEHDALPDALRRK